MRTLNQSLQITPAGARTAIEILLAGPNRVMEGIGFGGSEPFIQIERMWNEQRGKRPPVDTSPSLQ